MRSKPMLILASVLLAVTSTLIAQAPSSPLHKPAPQFVRTDLDHARIDLAAYRGRVVLLNFWATSCAPCVIEMPRFIRWQQQYGPAGLQVIGISMDDDAGPVQRLMRKQHVDYPVIMGDAELGSLYGGVLGLPTTFLIDRQGNIAAQYKGGAHLAAMQRELERLLRQK